MLPSVFCTMHPLDWKCGESGQQGEDQDFTKKFCNNIRTDFYHDFYQHPSGAGYLAINRRNTSCWYILPENVTAYVALAHHGNDSGDDIITMVIKYNSPKKSQERKPFKGRMDILDKLESYRGSDYYWRYPWKDCSENEVNSTVDIESTDQIEFVEDSQLAIQIHAQNFSLDIVWIGNGYEGADEPNALIVGWDAVKNQKVAYVVDLTNGESIQHQSYLFGERTDLFGSCIFEYRGLTMVAGGYKEINQISAVFPNRMVRIGSLPFPLSGATCTSDDDGYVYLCFTDDSPSTCWITKDLKHFKKLSDSRHGHKASDLIMFNNYPTTVSQDGIDAVC